MQPQGRRLPWDDVPAFLRAEIAAALGSEVVAADNQPGGFSPGLAARCELADGQRCFIKAVSSAQNPTAPEFYRREALINSLLPAGLPVPTLVTTIDDGDWVVLVFEEIDGHTPRLPWTMEDLAATFAALNEMSNATTPCPIPDLPTFVERYANFLNGFRRLAAGHPNVEGVDDWTRRHLDRLAALESDWEPAAAGDALLHSDLRADNLLVRPDGSVVVVDWPHACSGAAWIDLVCMLPSVGLDGGPSPFEVERQLDPLRGTDPNDVNPVIVGLAGYFTFEGLEPDPPGLPTLRAFQRAQGELARTWVAQRLGLP